MRDLVYLHQTPAGWGWQVRGMAICFDGKWFDFHDCEKPLRLGEGDRIVEVEIPDRDGLVSWSRVVWDSEGSK